MRNQRSKLKYSLNQLYKVIGISKQAVHQEHIRQQQFDQKLSELILQMDILRIEHPGCGLEKAYDTLRPDFIGRDRFVYFFMELGYRIKFPKNYLKTTKPGYYRCKNLIEGMIVDKVNQVVQSDITYIPIKGDFYYAIFIIDVFSKRITGYQVSNHMRKEANLKALNQLIRLRGKPLMNRLIHHSDRGSQYGSLDYRQLLSKVNAFISMGDSATKNAYAERVNGIIKNEYLAYWNIPDLKTLNRCVKKAVAHYNLKRIHRHLPMKLSPILFEQKWQHSLELKQHRELIHNPNNFVIRSKQQQLFKTIEKNKGEFCPLNIH